MTWLRPTLSLSILLAACGPEAIGQDGADELDSTAADSSTSDASSTDAGSTDTGSTATDSTDSTDASTDSTDSSTDATSTDASETGVDTDGFGNGDDTCEGAQFGECTELAWADLTEVVFVDAGNDGAWNPGETLTATVTYASTGDFINYPALVSQTDNPLVTVPWATSGFFGVLPDQPITYEVAFEADPAIEPGTLVGLHIGAAVGLGDITACDCPDARVDAWVEYLLIE